MQGNWLIWILHRVFLKLITEVYTLNKTASLWKQQHYIEVIFFNRMQPTQKLTKGFPDGQLYDRFPKNFSEILSCFLAMSGQWCSVVRTVALPLQAISLCTLHVSEPWEWSSGRLIWYTEFPYLMYARPDYTDRGPDVSKLNYNTCLMDEPVRTGIHVVWTVAVIFPYLCFGKKSWILVEHWESSGCAAKTSGRMQAGAVRNFSTQGKVWTGSSRLPDGWCFR
jgi:hypothetical protein